jgi:hypothetical protein
MLKCLIEGVDYPDFPPFLNEVRLNTRDCFMQVNKTAFSLGVGRSATPIVPGFDGLLKWRPCAAGRVQHRERSE